MLEGECTFKSNLEMTPFSVYVWIVAQMALALLQYLMPTSNIRIPKKQSAWKTTAFTLNTLSAAAFAFRHWRLLTAAFSWHVRVGNTNHLEFSREMLFGNWRTSSSCGFTSTNFHHTGLNHTLIHQVSVSASSFCLWVLHQGFLVWQCCSCLDLIDTPAPSQHPPLFYC